MSLTKKIKTHIFLKLFVAVFYLNAAYAVAGTIAVSVSGMFGSGVTADQLAAPGAIWALNFGVEAAPAATNTDAFSFDAPFSNFSYLLNGSAVAALPQSIRFYGSGDGGLFTVFFGPETGFFNGMPIPEFSFSGGQVFSGTAASPAISLGSYPVADALYTDALNFDDQGASGNVAVAANSTPEPSTFWLLSGILPLLLLRSYLRVLYPRKRLRAAISARAFRCFGRIEGLNARTMRRCAGLLSLALLPGVARAQVNKRITVVPGQPTFAVATWYIANCSEIIAVGIYSVNQAPQFGQVSFGSLSAVPPGCPATGPALPAVVAYYTLNTMPPGIPQDFFQLLYSVNGLTQTENISVVNGQVQTGKALGGPNTPAKQLAAEPIDVASGNVYYSATDYTTAGQNPLSFTRYYNSLTNMATQVPYPGTGNFVTVSTLASGIGTNWRSNFDRYLKLTSASTVIAERPDGQQLTFTLNGSTWTPDTDVDSTLTNSGNQWKLTDQNDAVETYTTIPLIAGYSPLSLYAQLNSIRLRNGYTQTLNYSGGSLFSVSDSYNRTLGFTYSNGLLQSVTTPDGSVVTYGYGTLPGVAGLTPAYSSRLSSVTYSTTPATTQTYVYENTALPTALTGVIDENGKRYLTWTYDSTERGISSQLGAGVYATTLTYNADGSRVVTNALGVQDTYTFSILQNIPKVTQISRAATATTAAATKTFTYDDNGYVASETDWNANQTTYTNNAHGEPTTINEAVGSSVARTTTITYDTTFVHLPKQIVTPGVTFSYTYDGTGELLTSTLTDTTTSTVPYSTQGQTRTSTNSWSNFLLASVKSPNGNTTSFTYDGSGALTETTNALGQKTHITAHTGGGLSETIVDPNGVTTTLAYDARQRLLTSSVGTSQGARTTSFSYDAAGNLTKTTQPDGSALSNTYNAAHLLTTITDLFHQNVAYTLDMLGDRTQTNLTSVGNRIQRQHSNAFDALGRTLKDIGGMGQTTVYAYDPNGDAINVTDPLGRVTTQAFDALNRLGKITDPNGGVTTTAYDAHDRVLSVTDPNGNVTSYIYDGFGDLIQQKSPDSGTTVYRYDGDGNLISKIDARGTVTNNTYDALDRILTTAYPSNAAENVAYTYDQADHGFGIGRLTSVTDAAGTLIRSYDERGNRLNDVRVGGGATLATLYTFDAASRLASITYPSGWTAAYNRDIMGRVYQVPLAAPGGTSAGNAIANATYEPFGPLFTLSFGNGVNESRRFDLDYRVTSLTETGTRALQSLTYAYDANDNVSSIADGVTSTNSQSFGYDVLNRLTSAGGGYGSFSWTYDKVGNRLKQTLGAAATTYAYTAGTNRLSGITAGSTTTPVGYVASGNISSIPPSPGNPVASLTYNAANRLSSVSGTPLAISGMIYDAFGQRFSKADPGSNPTLFTYGQDGSLLEESPNGSATDYVYLNGRPIATIAPARGKVYFLHDDRLGTPQLATDAGQNIVWSTQYQPFGDTGLSTSGSTITQNLRFPGQYFDGETGWNHNDWRDYVPSSGRYLQADPVGLAGGLNSYMYVGANPSKGIDPTGLIKVFGFGSYTWQGRHFPGGSVNVDFAPIYYYDGDNPSASGWGTITAVGVDLGDFVGVYKGIEKINGQKECLSFYEAKLQNIPVLGRLVPKWIPGVGYYTTDNEYGPFFFKGDTFSAGFGFPISGTWSEIANSTWNTNFTNWLIQSDYANWLFGR